MKGNNMANTTPITINTVISAPVEKVWEMYTDPKHVVNWNNASDDWHTPKAENDLKVGGKFNYRMESKDGAHGFDFAGTYEEVELNKSISYIMDDNRQVQVLFTDSDDSTEVTVIFDPEETNSLEMQKDGWQAILDSFKKYVESQGQ
jgi:uncharacterized protein YndB with AHSA1/START domain